MYAIQCGDEVFKVYGFVNESGWLNWTWYHDGGYLTDSGVSRPGDFCEWSERENFF